MQGSFFHVIHPVGLRPMPDKNEELVAELCAVYFHSDVTFVLRGTNTTPDIKVLRTRQFWEIKNIRGASKHTVEDNLRKASRQSTNVIVSLLANSKLSSKQAENRIRHILKTQRMPLKRVLLITRSCQIIDIK